ncbi:MAG TPA: hypothetical protein VHF50_05020 [Solirubrobacterales bacterium]|nr:hypothetical protein [Solirubrobacterales bacterium]
MALLYPCGPRADREQAAGSGLRPRHRLGPEVARIALAPLGLIAFSLYLHFALGDAFAWQSAQELFGRRTVDPFTGLGTG